MEEKDNLMCIHNECLSTARYGYKYIYPEIVQNIKGLFRPVKTTSQFV
jgi:hypothetical protein